MAENSCLNVNDIATFVHRVSMCALTAWVLFDANHRWPKQPVQSQCLLYLVPHVQYELPRKSFELWNPGWEVRALDEKILPDVLGDYCKQFTSVCKVHLRDKGESKENWKPEKLKRRKDPPHFIFVSLLQTVQAD